jgi:signal transduction histidine kinase
LKALDDTREFARLDAANQAKNELLANLSHELRTPLHAIAGYVDLLIQGIFGDMTKEQFACIERIRASEQHLLGLVDDLLDLGKIEAGRLTYHIAPFALGDVVSNVATIVGPLALAHRISIDWQPTDPTAIANADPKRVEQIGVNLVMNAVKFTESGGHVVVRHFVSDDRVVLEVSDNGRGIPLEFQEVIFEPFKQLGQPFVEGHPGTGLGLAISRNHARGMQGDLTVRSLEKGSTFTLELPRPE